jgi:hypothetical protein
VAQILQAIRAKRRVIWTDALAEYPDATKDELKYMFRSISRILAVAIRCPLAATGVAAVRQAQKLFANPLTRIEVAIT